MEDSLKLKLVEKLINTKEDSILQQVKFILDDDADFASEFPSHVLESIKIAKEELASGKGIPHEKAMQEIKSKFLKK
jgi:hypothetical protein